MRRFWKEATVAEQEGGWAIRLDGRPLKTPARAALIVPTRSLAEAIVEEWGSVGETINPVAMRLTGLANAAIDHVGPDRPAFARALANYAEADLTCYRADGPQELVERQVRSWAALLGWARRRFDLDFATTSGLMHVGQPPATIEILTNIMATLDDFRLAGLSPLVTIGGSLVCAIAVLEKAINADEAWDAVSVDERWQLEQWGADPEAQAALENRRRDFMAAARFLDLLG